MFCTIDIISQRIKKQTFFTNPARLDRPNAFHERRAFFVMTKRKSKRLAELSPEKQEIIREWNRNSQRNRRNRMTPEERLQERINNAISLLRHHGYTVTREGGAEDAE